MSDGERPWPAPGSFDDETTTGWTPPADLPVAGQPPASGQLPASGQPPGSGQLPASGQPPGSGEPPALGRPSESTVGPISPPPSGPPTNLPAPPWPFHAVIPPAPGTVPPPLPGHRPFPTLSGPVPPGAQGPAASGPSLSRSALPPNGDDWRGRAARPDGPGAGPIVFGLLLILVGGFLLARELVPELRIGLVWPYVVVGLGLVLILVAFLRPPRARDDQGWR